MGTDVQRKSIKDKDASGEGAVEHDSCAPAEGQNSFVPPTEGPPPHPRSYHDTEGNVLFQ